MKESTIWQWMVRWGAGTEGFRALRIENALGSATPDVMGSFGRIGFWAELKAIHGISKDKSRGRLKFQPGQREFAVDWWRAGFWTFILVRMGDEIFVIPGGRALDFEEDGTVGRADLAAKCILEGGNKLDRLSFCDFLCALKGKRPEIALPPLTHGFSPAFATYLLDTSDSAS